MNNFEKIKAMSIDEMAELIRCDDCFYCEARDICGCWHFDESHENCIKYAKQWLESESEEE